MVLRWVIPRISRKQGGWTVMRSARTGPLCRECPAGDPQHSFERNAWHGGDCGTVERAGHSHTPGWKCHVSSVANVLARADAYAEVR
jgi:hypothetical protein